MGLASKSGSDVSGHPENENITGAEKFGWVRQSPQGHKFWPNRVASRNIPAMLIAEDGCQLEMSWLKDEASNMYSKSVTEDTKERNSVRPKLSIIQIQRTLCIPFQPDMSELKLELTNMWLTSAADMVFQLERSWL